MAITIEEVRNVVNTEEQPYIIEQMIITANQMLVNTVDNGTITAAARDQVQIWLAAHFLSIRDRIEKEISADGIRMVFDGSTDMGLQATLYGQQAMLLDPTGTLAKTVGKKGRLNFFIEKDFVSRWDP